MSGRRISVSLIDWAKITERVLENERPKLAAFRAKSDSYLRRMNSSPESPPKIDWVFYKKVVPIPGMVDNFQKQYESMIIPYPSDTVSSLIDTQEQQMKKDVEVFKTESEKRIKKYAQEMERIHSLIPYDQMTLEEFRDAHPELALDPLNNPTFWPHEPDDQPGYKSQDEATQAH